MNLNSKQAAELLRAFKGWCPTPKSCPRVNVSLGRHRVCLSALI